MKMRNREMMMMKMMIMAIIISTASYYVNANPIIFDITSYGATPNRDIAQALLSAWRDATASSKASKIVIPAGKWLLSQAQLMGPNLAPLELQNHGTVQAYADVNTMPDKEGQWITINYVTNFTLSGAGDGSGVFDGQGQQAWKLNDCSVNAGCPKLPINLSFNFVRNAVIRDVTSKDSKSCHVNCISSTNVSFTRFTASAPGDSPNTDGIHVARSKLVFITDSVIGTGDDCVSMGDDLEQVRIRNLTCGPGHGVSIGSLGGSAAEKDVVGIYVQKCRFVGTSNGVRIKTWPSAPATLRVRELHFEDLVMENAGNPIVIDQQYCPYNRCNLDKGSLIEISEVTIKNVRGTTYSASAMTLDCSSAKPCFDVRIGYVALTYNGTTPVKFNTTCANIHPILFSKQYPSIC